MTLINNGGVIESELLDAERRRVRELDEMRRALQVDRDRQRERVAELEERLRMEGSAVSESQQHVSALRAEADRSGRLIESLQADVMSRTSDLNQMRERQLHLERRLLDAEAELQRGGGGANHRVLAGKVSALEDLVRAKQAEIEDEQRRLKMSELRLVEAGEQAAQLRGTVEAKDREIGETAVALREVLRAKERVEHQMRESHEAERELERKVDDLTEQLRAAGESSEVEQRQHKEDVRAKSRELGRLEVILASLQEELKEAAALKVNHEKEIELLRQQAANSSRDAKGWQARQEAVQVLQATETAAKEDAQREVTRLRSESAILHDELRAHAKQCEQYEALLREADKEREVREALDAQVRVLQASFERQEHDFNALRTQHESVVRRCGTLEQEAAKVVGLERKAAEFEALAELRLEQVEKGRQRESMLQTELETTTEQHGSARMECEEARRDFVLSHERCLHLQKEIVDLEQQQALIGEAQARMSQLNDAYEQRTAEVNHMVIELQSWQLRFKEADAEATNLRSFVVKVQSAEERFSAAQEQIRQREDMIRAMERKMATFEQQGREYEEMKHSMANTIANLEQEMVRVNGQLADRGSLESRLQSAIHELGVRAEELSRERNKVLDLQARGRERDEIAAQERNKRGDAETHAHHLQSELTKVQVELGRVTVQLESCERERARLEHLLQQRTAQMEDKVAHADRMERALQEKDEELRVRAITDTNVRHEIELGELRARELGSLLAQARRTVDEQKEQVRKADEERRHLAQRAELLSRVEEKLIGAEAALRARDEDLAASSRAVSQLKQKMKEMQAEHTVLRQAEQRVIELKALMDRQSLHLEQAEKEDAAKSQKIIEKEREVGRAREKLAATQGELDAEKMRRSQAEATARELEAAGQKAVQLEGQLAGVSQVLSQRTRDLEEQRHLVNELRERMRERNGGAGGKGNGGHMMTMIGGSLSAAEMDAKVRAKDETIARLEQEEQRRHALVDSLRRDLAAAENEKASLEQQMHDLQSRFDRSEVSWRARCTRLEQENSDGKRIAVDTRTRRLEEELLDVKCRNSTLSSEVDRLKREVSAAQADAAMMSSSASGGGGGGASARDHQHYGGAASSRLQQEMRRSRASLEGINQPRGGGGDDHESPYTSPEPKRRTVRSVNNSAAAAAASAPLTTTTVPRSFLTSGAGPSSPLNL